MIKQEESAKDIQALIGRMLGIIPLTPNQWTLLSVVVALLACAMVTLGNLQAGLALFALAAAFDVIDGAVARARGEVSALGGFIDGVADRFVEALFLFSFMFYPLPVIAFDPKIWLALAIFLGTCMPSFIRAYADHKGVISREKALALGGICERGERVILLVLGLGLGIFVSMEYFVYSLIMISCLSLVTVLQRIWYISREGRAQPKVKA